MPRRTSEKERARQQLAKAQEDFETVSRARKRAILAAVTTGVPLRDVSGITGLSYETVRRVAHIPFQLEEQVYPITEHQADVFVYKLSGFNVGAFPKDVHLLDVGTDWLPACGDLARAIQRFRNGEDDEPIRLDGDQSNLGFALYQVLRLSYMDRPSDVSRLYDALATIHG